MRSDDPPLAAGGFSDWLAAMRAALRGERDADVPCDGCTACCRSSQFVPIGPEEADTLARIPGELLFPAPRRPRGHVLLGYDEHGCCPMLVDDACSIYEHRPRACRTYDCRVFAAAEVVLDVETKVEVAARVRRWRFDHPTERDEREHQAVRAAARAAHEEDRSVPPTPLAVLAVERYEAFLGE